MKPLILILMTLSTSLYASEVHVAVNGNDANAGTAAEPFATFERARDAVRGLRPLPKGGVTVWLTDGVYRRGQAFVLSEGDSGTAESPITYRSHQGGRVRIIGGITVKPDQIKPVDPRVRQLLRDDVRDRIVEIDLAGMTHVGPWRDVFKDGATGLIDLYINGNRMPLAQYPNKGSMAMKRVIGSGDLKQKQPGSFLYSDARHEAWQSAVERGLWFKGFWRVPWQSEYVRVAEIDTTKKIVVQAGAVSGGIGSKYKRPHGSGKEPYIAVNLPEEIDMLGEWCIDFEARKLYLLPPCNLSGAEILIADSAAALVKLDGASYTRIQGITFEANWGDGIEIVGGTHNLIAGCTLLNLGGSGVVVKGGTKHRVLSCDIHHVGAEGIFLQGGNRKTLEPCGHEASNNHIHHFARIKTIYAAGINVGHFTSYGVNPDAVGITVRNNLIHDAPHVGVLYRGNDHLLEFNEIHRVVQVSGDMGGFYTCNDWTSRGNVLRFNLVHSSPKAEAIYCDDGDSGDTITGNVFYDTHTGVFIGGGHDNIVTGNIAVACERGFHLDARGVSRNYNATNKRMVNAVKSVNHKQPPWSTKYPDMVNLLEFHPELPTGTLFSDNLAVGCKRLVTWDENDKNLRFCKFSRNTAGKQTYPDLRSLRLALGTGELSSPAKSVGRIPISRIGLFVDEYRTSLPRRPN